MTNITFSIPDDLKTRMAQFEEINWSAVTRLAIDEKLKDLEFLKLFKAKSKATEEDAVLLGRKIKTGLAKRNGVR